MVGKGEAIGHTANAVNYAKEKQKAVEIDRGMVAGETKDDIFKEFQMIQQQNTRCKNNTFSFVVSPTAEDGKRLSDGDFKNICRDFLKRMNLDDRQYVAYKHIDNGNPHLHIYANRIGLDGKAAPDKFLSNRASRTADLIAEDRGLRKAKDVQIEKQAKLSKEYAHVFDAHKDVLKRGCKSLDDYSKKMKAKGFEPVFKFSSKGKAVGVNFKIGDKLIKGSAINKVMSATRIEKAVFEVAKTIAKQISKGLSI